MSETRTQSQFSEAGFDAMVGGLTDPVFQSQSIFRTIMNAMARPGLIMPLVCDAQPVRPMLPLTAGVLATLADADTPIWLDGDFAKSEHLSDWLTFHVGAPFAAEPASAAFAVIAGGKDMPSLDQFAQGLQEYPDRSATLIIQVDHLSNKAEWELFGPGIKGHHHLSVSSLSPLFLTQWQANHELFPRGVDVIFVAPEAITCLPRTTTISLMNPTAPHDQEH
nr:phosphonate C-P lyase system protein PhnH [uncultured Cohaesibacter sp.]